MLKHIVLAALLSGGAVAAYAQPQQAASPPASATTEDRRKSSMAPSATADARKLIGRNVKNADGDTIGEIKSVYISPDGKVDSVMVGVGGFLGVGEREVRLAWKDLQIADNGEKVIVNMTKDQLKAMAPYNYKDTSWRGKVFSDRGIWTEEQRAARDARATADKPLPSIATARWPTTRARPRRNARRRTTQRGTTTTKSTGDFNAAGDVSANAVIGAKMRNENKDTVGTVRGPLSRRPAAPSRRSWSRSAASSASAPRTSR